MTSPPPGTRAHFGALVPGAKNEAGSLSYGGDPGTGFSGAELDRLMGLMTRLDTPTCPFAIKPRVKNTAPWVKPVLVAQIRYAEMTDEGRLRHPSYLGLRDDKAAQQVTVPRENGTANDAESLIDQLNYLQNSQGKTLACAAALHHRHHLAHVSNSPAICGSNCCRTGTPTC